jgi:hypothetical protein
MIYVQVSAVFATYMLGQTLSSILMYLLAGLAGAIVLMIYLYSGIGCVCHLRYMLGLLSRQTLSSILMSLLVGMVRSLILI